MDQLLTFLKIKLLQQTSIHSKFNRHIYLLIFGIFILPTVVLAEGSKEIYVGTNNTKLLIDSWFSGGNSYINFAAYDCLDSERLKIDVNSTDEIIYLGFDGEDFSDRHIVYRIKDLDGNIVKPEEPLPTAGIGFINNIDEARAGPIALGNPTGYNAEVWIPPDVGTYYIEFVVVLNSNGNPTLDHFYIDLFDITVANSITNTAIPGRLYAQGWQFSGTYCSSKFYIYSNDSIITSVELNYMNGAVWRLFCNQTGVGTTGDFYEDRKSIPNENVFLPEYNIFLNEPDSVLFPPATSLGHIYGDVIGQPYCDGTIDFTFNVDKSGSAEIELTFDPPFVTRVLQENVNVGTNIISWDGYDGTLPNHLQIPNGTNVTFSTSYINGLTNLPLCDVNKNDSGFVVELVNPAGSSPIVFWDDSNTGGTTNFIGCSSTSNPWEGCHTWIGGEWCTINTWWYNVSTTTAPVTVVSQRTPDTLVFDQPQQNYCADTMGIPISVAVDPNTSTYTWGFTGNDGTITQLLPSDNFITIDFGPLATSGDIFVYGINDSCGSGDTSFLFIGIQELPYVSAGLDDTICDNQTITLAGDTLHSTGALWTTSGDGVFSDATILTPVYTPGVIDFANGSVELMLEANAIAPCVLAVQDTMLLTFSPPPIADAGADQIICSNTSITLSGDTTNSNTCMWSTAGDGTFDDINLINATYTPGSNDIANLSVVLTLTAISPCAISDQDDMTLSIDPQPIADAGGNQTMCLNTSITLSGTITNSVSSLWSTNGDGSFVDPTLLSATYTPGAADIIAGFVNLSLTAFSMLSCTIDSIDVMTLTFYSMPQPQIDILPNDTVCINEAVNFMGTDAGGANILLWEWDFGDGNSSVGQNPTHIYNGVLEDSVRLIATNDTSCVDTIYHNIWVMNPTIGLNISPVPACLGDTISITGTGDIVTYTDWNWDFGDGDTHIGRDTVHLYATPDTFEITLSVCSITLIDSAIIYQAAISDAGSDETLCQSSPFDFSTSTVQPSALNYDSLLWYGGIGTFSDAKTLLPVYTPGVGEEGSVELFLVAYGLLPCSNDTASMILTLDSLPEPAFNFVPNDSICINEMISFSGINNNTTTITNWDWDMGDGNINTIQNPVHSFATNGIFDVQLTLTNAQGCIDSVMQQITVNQLPDARITVGPNDTICAQLQLSFSGFDDNATTITDWDWDFGEGNIASGQNVVHTYLAAGTYDVTLYLTNDNSCMDTVVRNVFIRTLPVSDFTISPNDTTCMGELINLDATNITSDITQWNWQFGDGNIAVGQNVTHTYTNPVSQTYNILSIYQNANGCLDTTIHTRYVQDVSAISFNIIPFPPTCQDYTVNFQGTPPLVTFTPWNWTFGDGSAQGLGHNTSHIYTSPDTVDVVLNVCSEQEIQQLIINAPCQVDAGSNEVTCQDVYFDLSTSTILPTADDFSSLLWYTDGLGTISGSTTLYPTYFPDPTEGSFVNDTIIMTLVGIGIPPCADDTSIMELVVIPGAYAHAGSDEDICFGETFDFANSNDSAFATNYATINWYTSGTGSFSDPNIMRPVYFPGVNEIGSVTLTMVAANIINCDSIDDMVLTIRPTYEMPVDITVCYYDSVYLQGAWRYASGIFYDTLQTANYGCDSVFVTNLTVRPKIDRDFVISTGDSICFDEIVGFISVGTANLTSWLWDFGDGTNTTVMNPTHQYNASGPYTIIYYYTDDNGCSDSVTRQVTVFDIPDVDFTISMTNACVNTQVGFVGTSNSIIVLWEWDFGDGQTGVGQNTSHVYTTWGDITVALTVTDINGCTETMNKYLTIAQPPTADFTYEIVLCDSLQFTDLSLSPPGYNIVTWDWDFGDGVGTSNLQNPTYQYPSNTTPGGEVYNVILTIAADSVGFICTDSVVLPVIVPSLPDIFFTWTPDPSCLGDTTYFFGESGFPIETWHWDFDDGDFSLDQYATHIYTATGTYNVFLDITDTNGCVNTLNNIITVDSIPEVSFTMSDSVLCHGTEIQFTSTASTNVETWYWEFGDGSFSPDQNPIHFYPSGGNYIVTLTVTDSSGCSNTATDNVLILPAPTADYSYQNLTCTSVVFTDLSTAPTGYNLVEWFWDFDDGFTANVQNPSHSFAGGMGVYDVMLIVTADSSGFSCTDTIIQTVLTPGLPTVFFTWNPEPTMLGDATSFFGTSGNTIIDWYWDFDDGNFATTQDATNTFATVGTFDVELTVTDIDGCVNTVIHQVTVTNVPELDYSWDNACQGDEIQFYIDSPPTDIPAVVSWAWDFGDGGVSTDMEPTHVYITAGTYNVSLTIVDTMNATNTVIKPITVNPLPNSLFSIDSPTCEGNPVQFHDHSTTPTGFITEWLWDFGDGNTTTVVFPNNPDVTYTYGSTGTFIVTLTITNSDSCSNSTQNPVTTIPSPMAMFTSSSGCASGPVSFTDTSIENGGSTIILWEWNFDDPASGPDNTSVLQNPIHQFTAAGDYDVQLIITNINGCADTTVSTITVADEPEVEFNYSEVCLGSETQFTVDGTVTNIPEVQTWAWSFGDGGTSNLQNPSHTYAATGDYDVTLVIVTTDGCTASITHTIRINPLPNPNFAHTGPACLNDTVYFTDLSSSPNGLITTWHWDFGDGTDITITAPDSPDVSHIYTNDATFAVTLTVTDSDTCENLVVKNVEVVPSPIADYTFEETCYNDPVFFTDLSTTNGGTDIMSWEWFFGDLNSGVENTSTLQNPTHVFSDPGIYTTTLIIVSTLGCNDTTEQDITIDPAPDVDFSILDDSICLGESAEFTGISTSDISTWYWDFGDGGSSIEQNPSYMYGAPGTYIVTLTVTETGTDACQNSISYPISVNDAPEANFDYENNCLGDSTYFTDLSYSQTGFIMSWDWDFGDGGTSTVEDPTHYYLINDEYQVTLISTDNYGCSDTITQYIQIFDVPVPGFSFDQVCDPIGQVNFFDESEPGSDNSQIIGWNWNLYDGYYSTEIDPSYIYPYTDTCYTVVLEITDGNGCIATDTNTQVCLHGTLEIDFTSTQECLGTPTFFSTTYAPASDSVASYTWNFNDGSPLEVTYRDTISHIFPNPTTYIVELVALDTNGCSTSTFHQVTIDSLPTSQFTNTIGSCNTPTQFTEISFGGGEFIEFWYWDFGDIVSGANNTSTLENPTHLYGPYDSTYQVKLIVTNFNGCTDSVVQDVYVEPCLLADFGLPTGNNCARYELCFSDTSQLASNNGVITQWRWDFGDGNIYNYGVYQNPICHTYQDAGDYDVQLIVVANINGTSYNDTVTKTFTVNPTPLAGITVLPNCFGDSTMFLDNTTTYDEPLTMWHWDFGDDTNPNDTSIIQNPAYLYPTYGTYITELKVMNQYLCRDSITTTVDIYKPPEAAFSFADTCMSYYTYFSDESIDDSSAIISYNWNFGDTLTIGDTSDLQYPTYIYDTTGNYIVELIVSDGNTCRDTISHTVNIYPIPTSDFIIMDTIQQGQIYLNNISIGAIDYYWDFDYDYGQSSTETDPTHQYDVDGNYTIMLVSYNEFICPDTIYQIYDLLFTNLFVPNAFIPANANPELQTFKPIGINLLSYRLEVYSAWGNLVFESTALDNGAPAEGWDGTYENKALPTGSYIWRISAVFEDGSFWKGTDNGDGNTATSGTVTLIR